MNALPMYGGVAVRTVRSYRSDRQLRVRARPHASLRVDANHGFLTLTFRAHDGTLPGSLVGTMEQPPSTPASTIVGSRARHCALLVLSVSFAAILFLLLRNKELPAGEPVALRNPQPLAVASTASQPTTPDALASLVASGPTITLDAAHLRKIDPNPLASPETDPEWATFPRDKGGITSVLLGNITALNPADWYRSGELNPRDVYIPSSHRKLFESVVTQYTTHIKDIQTLRRSYQRAEFDIALAAGKTQTRHNQSLSGVAYKERYPKLADYLLKKVLKPGVDLSNVTVHMHNPAKKDRDAGTVAFRRVGDVTYDIPIRDLPQTAQVAEYEVFKHEELAAIVLTWFSSVGACPESTLTELFAKLGRLRVGVLGKGR